MKLNEQRRIFKINSNFLKKSKWDLTIPLDKALTEYPEMVVSLNDSQLLRWLDELNGIDNANAKIRSIKNKIKNEKRKTESTKTKNRIKSLYRDLNNLQFQKDYVCVVMDSLKDYDRANKGFTINGIKYRRLLGTNGGIKNSTIVYINEDLYPEISRRIANGRNPQMELVPAKLEAYQALVCSGSTPIPQPHGIIVVDDCITHFKDDVIVISNENDGEPELTYQDNFDIEHNNSDGFGLMLPCYASRVNEFLTGDNSPIAGMNTRYSFEKGMVYTFPFDEFAEQIAGTYVIRDVWGDMRDIRQAEVILTASMVKLWDSYSSWEDYYNNCQKNHYEFATPKICPAQLENVRTTNYQFLQSYHFTDEEIKELCQPTIDEINDALGGDYRKSLVYMAGANLNKSNVDLLEDDFTKAIMINPEMINDPYVKTEIYKNIRKKIDRAKKGKIAISANYAMISGDPFALCQSMFGLKVTGLLNAGEVYHKHWIDKGAKEIVCFRAPMTCHNNIRKMRVNQSEPVLKWFRYINTACILNAWDSTCEAENGADFDGDTFFTTDNPILLKNSRNEKTIICMQQKAEKKIPTEDDIIAANKIAFNDEIGQITNRVTAMFEKQAQFESDSAEYKELAYRIMCGQHFQQCSIDRCKGIISKPMPESWYVLRKDGAYTDLEKNIVADRKPYFMQYVYPDVKTEYDTYIKNCNTNSIIRFGMDIAALYSLTSKSDEVNEFVSNYEKYMPLGGAACTINKIAWLIENAFDSYKPSANADFDCSILKSNVGYSAQKYNSILAIYTEFCKRISDFARLGKTTKMNNEEIQLAKNNLIDDFRQKCDLVCLDDEVLTDIVIDICYKNNNKSKSFAWMMCGHQIIKNLLSKSGNTLQIPIRYDKGEFEFNGLKFTMATVEGANKNETIYIK